MVSKGFIALLLLISLMAVFLPVARVNRATSPPHMLFFLVDDLGWSDVGFHGSKIQTPNIDKLASEGVVLDNYYVLPICTPTRSALMSGRYPIHTGLQHGTLSPESPYGLPLNFTILPQKLKESGYLTHMIGKWHLGYNKWAYTPTYRGFDTFYGSYNGGQDHYNHKRSEILDFRDNEEPVRDLDGKYGTFAFAERAKDIIKTHNALKPLFLYMAFQNVHAPVQAPQKYTDKYSFIEDETRRTHAGMVDIVDEAVGNITEAMKDAGLWEDTLMILTTDNGGMGRYGGYNFPLRGEKHTLWEGGVRGVSFVHGNMLGRRGVKCKELLHVTDWYPTLVNLAGGSQDQVFPPLDGMDVWNTISHGEPSPRTEILLNIDIKPTTKSGYFSVPTYDKTSQSVKPYFHKIALRMGHMKLLINVPYDTWYKPPELGGESEKEQGIPQEGPGNPHSIALYNIIADPTEREDLSEKLPEVVRALQKRVQYYMKGAVPPLNKPPDPKATLKAQLEDIWTPWQD